MASHVNPIYFGSLADGRTTKCFTLANKLLRVCVTDYGARLVSIESPDRDGVFGHVLLGFENAESYREAGGSFGAILGRYANRIDGGRFTLDGHEFQLAVNDADNTLHGGPDGFSKALWHVEAYNSYVPELVLSHVSPDGDQGFPGELSVRASYQLGGKTLWIQLSATTNHPTIVNLSSHPYFNLADVTAYDVLSHEITINAKRFLPTNAQQIPTGEQKPGLGSDFDFLKPKQMGRDIRHSDEQLLIGRGYDHCFVLNGSGSKKKRFAASAYDPATGRLLKLFTTQHGLQLYSGNSLNGSIVGRGGIAYRQSAGFAFEAQNFPDAPNHPDFPCAVLRPGETYRQTIGYEFSAS